MTDLGPLLGVPGVRAAVSDRADGGMGFTGAPDRDAVLAARGRLLASLGLDPSAAVAARQVHGSRVVLVGAGDREPGDADGLVTAEAGVPLLALAADCAVAVLAAADGRAVGVVHAGWRGAAAGAPAAAVEAFRRGPGIAPRDLRAAFAPAAGPCCYEVGPEVRDAFGDAAAAWFRPGPRGRPHLDLPAAVRAGLVEAGLDPARIGPAGPCTICGPRWFSHRRGDGRRQAVVVARVP